MPMKGTIPSCQALPMHACTGVRFATASHAANHDAPKR